MRLIYALLFSTLLMGCQSLELRNLGKSGASTAIAYASGGVVPAVGVLATSMAYDEIIPQEQELNDIETEEQAVAYVAESLFMNLLYFGIAYLLITLIAVPFIKRWGYNQAKDKYKTQVRVSEELIRKIKDETK